MSLKENIEMVKDELNSEEQFFEKAVQTERFVKKYKKPLITLVAVAILAVGVSSAYTLKMQNDKDAANTALNVLMINPNDTKAKETLKSINPKLFDVWSLSQALKSKDKEALKFLESSKALVVADLAEYELAALESDKNRLQSYAQKSDALYKDLALIEAAVLMMENGEKKEARAQLSMIDINSPVYELAQSLAHYGVN